MFAATPIRFAAHSPQRAQSSLSCRPFVLVSPPMSTEVEKPQGLKQHLAQAFLSLAGWQAEGAIPKYDKFVVIAAPHTTNWDGVYMVMIAIRYGIQFRWMVKHTLAEGVLSPIIRLSGGLGVDRRSSHNVVEQIVKRFEEADKLVLAIAPEGTRSLRKHWRSGFYHIAVAAKVPIVMGYLDYDRKRGGFSSGITPSGNMDEDIKIFREFYSKIGPKHPKNFGPIKFRDKE